VFEAFRQFLELDPKKIERPVGLAVTIASRRGQDVGRRINRIREFPDMEVVSEEANDPTFLSPEDELIEAERASDREALRRVALERIEQLPPGQAQVLRETILGGQELSDWQITKAKSYEAARKQREKALEALRRWIESKERGMEEGDDDDAD
jgi:DNA-directed RNA polymerase specialized sigma24 family protein